MDDLDLRAERERRGWSQAELARRAGLNPNSISMIERGHLIPYASQVRKLEAALADPEPKSIDHSDREACPRCGAQQP